MTVHSTPSHPILSTTPPHPTHFTLPPHLSHPPYPHYPKVVGSAVRTANVTGKHILVVGSSSPWVECLLLNEGARHVTTLEYLPNPSTLGTYPSLQP